MSLAAAVGLLVLAVGALLLLVLVLRLHALPSLLVVSLVIAVAGGIPLQDVASEVQQAMGGILGYIALVIGLGAIFGEMLERSGAARRIATTLLDKAGEGGAPAAFAVTGLVVAIPVFFDVGFILLLPLLHHTARRTGRTLLLYALPLLAGLAVSHAFVPPTPGPVAVAGLLGADLGWVIVFGLAAGVPSLVVAGLLFGRRAAERLELELETVSDPTVDVLDETGARGAGDVSAAMPGFGLSLSLVLLPLCLIVAATASRVLPVGGARPVLQLLGHPFSALLLTVLAASWLLARHCGWSRDQLRAMADRSLQPVGLILLVTGAGGVLGKVLLAAGAGQALADALGGSSLPVFVLAFLLALVVRVAQGSATVSMVTAAGLVAPIVGSAGLSAPALGLLTVAIAAGATAFSHVNDSGFWLVSKYLHLDERQTLLTWTPLTALISGTGLAVVLLLAPLLPAATPAAADTPNDIAEAPSWLELHDPELRALVPADAEIEELGTGYTWSEGPVWVGGGNSQDGFLLFSDVPEDTVYRWDAEHGVRPWIRPSGLTGDDPRSREPGANGLVIDPQGSLLLCQHGDRRVARLSEPPSAGPWVDGPVAPFETLARTYDGHRFHSPNDLVLHPSGDLYFTDPPYGLPGGPDSAAREMDHHGVYRLRPDGTVELLYAELTRPNGIILSPDGRMLYVANSDPERAIWMSWPVGDDGAVGEGSVLHDATTLVSDERPGLPDGMAVDADGRLFATGPGGIWVFAPDGRHLGTLRLADPTANCTFGDADGRSLFVTSNHRLLRIRLNTTGLGFPTP